MGLAAAALFLSLAGPAQGATFCVEDAECVAAGGTAQPTLQAAFNAANANGNDSDRVKIGATTLNAGGIANSLVEVIGAGEGQTTITGTGKIIDLNVRPSTIKDLSIVMDGNDSTGLETVGPAENVTVTGTSSIVAWGIVVGPGMSSDLTVDLAMDDLTIGLGIVPPNVGAPADAVVEDSTISAPMAGMVTLPGAQATLRRSAFDGIAGLQAGSGTILVEDSTIRTAQSAQFSAPALAAESSFIGASNLTARNLTIVGDGTGTGLSAKSYCSNQNGFYPATITARSTIVRGFATDLQLTGTSCDTLTSGLQNVPATIDIADSIYDPAKVTETGPASVNAGAGNLNVDPLFTDLAGGDLTLSPGSQAIEAGDPAGLAPGESPTDLAGEPRVIDSDGDGTAIRDIGAFEVVPDVERSLTLTYSAKRRLFQGKLGAPVAACRLDEVDVFRVKVGPDQLIRSVETNARGKFFIPKRASKGKYQARVVSRESEAGTCLAAKSPKVRVG
ncbi:hypothetical protein HJD18_06060 [Thermoleophilia bacterium SCSIO 60948]|nr:hypothetical protein HJD18_06060 [Thermoleophilia bacterium SCSIO 60948]